MAKVHGGRLVAKALRTEGVEAIFTLSGGHIQSIYDGCIDEGIRVVDTRHEQAAAHAAEGWSRTTGKLGTCVVTAGPGVTDAVTGVANAYQAGSPMLCIGGRSPFRQFEMGSLQEMDHTEFMKPITKWAKTCHETHRIPEFVSMAARIAFAGKPGPVFLEIPQDIVNGQVDEDAVNFPRDYRTESRPMGDPAYVRKAAEAIMNAEMPMIIAGSSIHWSKAHEDLQQFTRDTKLPVYLNGMGRGTVPADHPYFMSSSRRFALNQADVVVIIGTPIDFRLGFGRTTTFRPDVKVIQIDIDPREIGTNRAVDIGIVGDVKMVLHQLTDEMSDWMKAREETAWVEKLREQERKSQAENEPLLYSNQVPIHPMRLSKEIRDFISKDTIVIGDGGDIVSAVAGVLRIYQPGHWMDPGRLGCLGVGTGFAMAAQIAHPEKPVLIVNGDGTFGLNGMEFDSFVRHKLPIVSVVGNDGQWGQVIHGQIRTYGAERAIGSSLGFVRYDKMVEGLGGYGEFVERPEDIRPALERAFASGLPACVNVKLDPAIGRGRIPY